MKPDFKAYMLNEETLVMDSLPTDLSPYIAYLNRLIVKMIRDNAHSICLDVKNRTCSLVFNNEENQTLEFPESLDYQRFYTRIKTFGLLTIGADEQEQSNRIYHSFGHQKICFEINSWETTEKHLATITLCDTDG